jgi:hypothetical protein
MLCCNEPFSLVTMRLPAYGKLTCLEDKWGQVSDVVVFGQGSPELVEESAFNDNTNGNHLPVLIALM